MTPEDMAHLHARAFDGQGRAWAATEFQNLLDSAYVFAIGDARAFALGRVVAAEAELLTIATDPDHRRKGLAASVVAAFEAEATRRGASRLFLEVAQDNAAACALYARAGYHAIAHRPGYYHRSDGTQVDALILQKTAP